MTRELKVKSILITQNLPESGKSVFDELEQKHKLKIDYRSFIQINPEPVRELRNQRLNILDHTAVILTSKNAIDNFFRIAEEMRVELPHTFKYFCANESISNYIQKYIQVRKRKVFFGKGPESDFLKMIKTHCKENFLFPCSDIRKPSIPDFFTHHKIIFTEAIMYRTVSADLSDLKEVFYDIIVFFSPADIKSLFDNFPDFVQNDTRLAAFGSTTHQAIEDASLIIDILAPSSEHPSMLSAIAAYVQKANNNN